jgi:hypothetical protein
MRRLLDACGAALDIAAREAAEAAKTGNADDGGALQHASSPLCLQQHASRPACYGLGWTSETCVSEVLICCAADGEGEPGAADAGSSPAAAAPDQAPRLVGIGPAFRAIAQLQGGAQQSHSCHLLCIHAVML